MPPSPGRCCQKDDGKPHAHGNANGGEQQEGSAGNKQDERGDGIERPFHPPIGPRREQGEFGGGNLEAAPPLNGQPAAAGVRTVPLLETQVPGQEMKRDVAGARSAKQCLPRLWRQRFKLRRDHNAISMNAVEAQRVQNVLDILRNAQNRIARHQPACVAAGAANQARDLYPPGASSAAACR